MKVRALSSSNKSDAKAKFVSVSVSIRRDQTLGPFAVVEPTTETKMTKSTRNTGKHWSGADTNQMKTLARENTPTRVIGLKLGRTEDAVRSKAFQENISLKPTNQSPYNRRTK
jgi:hypothetical protein